METLKICNLRAFSGKLENSWEINPPNLRGLLEQRELPQPKAV